MLKAADLGGQCPYVYTIAYKINQLAKAYAFGLASADLFSDHVRMEKAMVTHPISRRTLVAVSVLAPIAGPALAHHGWAWTEDEKFELTGTVQEVFIGNPHAVLKIDAEDGLWIVELALPSPTRAAGFDENTAKVGDELTAIGNRASDRNERRMKAVQLIVNGKTFDIYPDSIGS